MFSLSLMRLSPMPPFLLLIPLLSFLAAGPAVAAKGEVMADPFPRPAPLIGELTEDVIFNVLAGEVAAYRHHLKQAYDHYRQAAAETGDPQLAERAAKIALFNNNPEELEKAVHHWVTRDPNNLEARRFALAVALDQGRTKEARQELGQLIKLAIAQGTDGFILAARALGKVKEGKQALELMQGLVDQHRADRNAWYALALLAAEFKEFKQAETAVDTALGMQLDWDKALEMKSRVLLAQQRNEEALELLRKAVTAAPTATDLRQAYARLLVQSERYQAAYDQFQQLLQGSDDAHGVRFTLGILAMELKQYDTAAEHFEAIKDQPGHRGSASFYLGRIAEERKQVDVALDWYRRVSGGDFELQAAMRIASLLAGRGEMAEARKELQQARGKWPTHAVRIYVAESAILKENKTEPQQIWSLFEQALGEFPEDIELLYARALFAALQGKVAQLEQDLGLVLKKQPKHADALNALGYTLADLTDRYQDALGYIKQALELKPDSPAILDSMGWVQYRLGNREQALDYLRQAAEKISDPEIAAHLGELLWVTGKQEEAREVWNKALREFSEPGILTDTMKRFGVQAP